MKTAAIPLLLACAAFSICSDEQAKADFASEYDEQKAVSWNQAQFEADAETFGGDKIKVRYQVLKNGEIFQIQSNRKNSPSKIGNITETKRSTGNTCLFGYNAQCASNIKTTLTQFKMEKCILSTYTKTSWSTGAEFGKVEKKELAKCRPGYTM